MTEIGVQTVLYGGTSPLGCSNRTLAHLSVEMPASRGHSVRPTASRSFNKYVTARHSHCTSLHVTLHVTARVNKYPHHNQPTTRASSARRAVGSALCCDSCGRHGGLCLGRERAALGDEEVDELGRVEGHARRRAAYQRDLAARLPPLAWSGLGVGVEVGFWVGDEVVSVWGWG